jgi:hypothetical protein
MYRTFSIPSLGNTTFTQLKVSRLGVTGFQPLLLMPSKSTPVLATACSSRVTSQMAGHVRAGRSIDWGGREEETEMKLTASRVETLFVDCLGNPGEDTVEVDIIVGKALFRRDKIEEHKGEIFALLMELPIEFRESGGGGWSFLNAYNDQSGRQWGEHQDMARLFGLGQAADLVTCQLPRSMWAILPGGVPYYSIKDKRDGN